MLQVLLAQLIEAAVVEVQEVITANAGSTGGSGVIVIRYPKDQAPLGNLVAEGTTGGSVTFEGDEAVHTFTSPGTFTSGADMNVDVLIVVGGGGGGADRGVEGRRWWFSLSF